MFSYRNSLPRFRTIAVLGAALFLVITGHANAQPCPTGSYERTFQMDRDLPNCVFGAVEGNSPAAGYGRFYNVYCPGRMSKNQAVDAANALANDRPSVPGNPIPGDYADFGLTPRYRYGSAATSRTPDDFRGIHHWFHYACGSGGVATHIKIEIGSLNPSSQEVAAQCSEVNRSGSIRSGGRVDVEYRCRIHLKPENRRRLYASTNCPGCRPAWVQEVAALKVRSDIAPSARSGGLQACLLSSTDIQCAPCQSSDKLVVRLSFVPSASTCPAGTTRTIQ